MSRMTCLLDMWICLVVVVGFIVNCISTGTMFASGTLFLSFLDYFQAGESLTSWIPATQASVAFLTGITMAPLLKIFSYRQLIIGSCMLSSCGFALSALAPNIFILCLTYGLITGVGNGVMYASSLIVTQQYMHTRKSLAAGVVSMGGGVGVVVFSLIVKAGVQWHGAVLIEAVIVLLGSGCAFLVQPLENVEIWRKQRDISTAEYESPDESTPLSSKHDVEEEPLISSSPDDAQESSDLSMGKSACCCLHNHVCNTSMTRMPQIYLVSASLFTYGFVWAAVFTFIPERTKLMTLVDDDHSNMSVTYTAIATTAGRLIFGIAGGIGSQARFTIVSSTMFLAGVSSYLLTLTASYKMCVIYSIVQGMCLGGMGSLISMIVLDTFGPDLMPKAMGLCLIGDGIGSLLGPVVIGGIIEGTGIIDNAFVCLSFVSVVGSLLVTVTYICFKKS